MPSHGVYFWKYVRLAVRIRQTYALKLKYTLGVTSVLGSSQLTRVWSTANVPKTQRLIVLTHSHRKQDTLIERDNISGGLFQHFFYKQLKWLLHKILFNLTWLIQFYWWIREHLFSVDYVGFGVAETLRVINCFWIKKNKNVFSNQSVSTTFVKMVPTWRVTFNVDYNTALQKNWNAKNWLKDIQPKCWLLSLFFSKQTRL